MPRTATLTESGNKNSVWTVMTINVVNYMAYVGISDYTQQQDLNTVKVGLVFRVRDSTDWSGAIANKAYGTSSIVIGADTYAIAEYTLTTSYVTKTMDSGNFKATKRYTQSDVDAMYYQERAHNTAVKLSYVDYTANRVHTVEYCYEHKVGGLAPMKFNVMGGLSIGKVWKIGGRSQISGTADIVYS